MHEKKKKASAAENVYNTDRQYPKNVWHCPDYYSVSANVMHACVKNGFATGEVFGYAFEFPNASGIMKGCVFDGLPIAWRQAKERRQTK